MFFVVDKPQLQRMIALTRDDRKRDQQAKQGPFFRIEASAGRVWLAGREVAADFSATVYEPGVLFLRVTLFRRALRMLKGVKSLAIQANADGLMFGNIQMPLEPNDMLLYVDPARAPQRHPAETQAARETAEQQGEEEKTDPARGTLWER